MTLRSYLDAGFALAHEALVAQGASYSEASRQLGRVGRPLTDDEIEEDNARAYAQMGQEGLGVSQ